MAWSLDSDRKRVETKSRCPRSEAAGFPTNTRIQNRECPVCCGKLQYAASGFRSPLPLRQGTGGVSRHRTLNPQIIRLIGNRTPEKSPIQTHQNSTSVSPPSVTPSPAHPNQTSFNLPSRKRAYPVTRWTSHPPQPPSALSPLPPGAGRCIHPGGWCVEKSRFPADRKMYVGRHLQVPGRLQDRISCSPFNVARRGVTAAMGEGIGQPV